MVAFFSSLCSHSLSPAQHITTQGDRFVNIWAREYNGNWAAQNQPVRREEAEGERGEREKDDDVEETSGERGVDTRKNQTRYEWHPRKEIHKEPRQLSIYPSSYQWGTERNKGEEESCHVLLSARKTTGRRRPFVIDEWAGEKFKRWIIASPLTRNRRLLCSAGCECDR